MTQVQQKPCARCKIKLTQSTYCDACQVKIDQANKQKSKRYDKSRGNSGQRGYGADWQKVRMHQLQEAPLCQCRRCTDMGRVKPADTVHHIISIEQAPELRLDPKNLMSMTWHCHEAEEGRAVDREYVEWEKNERSCA